MLLYIVRFWFYKNKYMFFGLEREKGCCLNYKGTYFECVFILRLYGTIKIIRNNPT